MNKGEVAAPLGLGPAPEWFDDGSRNLWDRIAAEAPPDVLTTADRLTVEEWIKLTAELTECRRIIRQDGMTITEERGSDEDSYTITKAHPLLSSLHQFRKQWVAIANQFGFSASARSTLRITAETEQEDAVDQTMKQAQDNRANGSRRASKAR